MKKQQIKPAKPALAWAIVDKWGHIYADSLRGIRRNAIEWLIDPDIESLDTWKKCYRRGFRVIRVRVSAAK